VYVEASIKPRKVNKPPRKVYQYNKANKEKLKEKRRIIDIENQLKEQDLNVDQLWNNFKEKEILPVCLSAFFL
jgi:DNA-binding PadR family transcriptional regulator